MALLQADMSALNIQNYAATRSPAARSMVGIESTHTAASGADSNQTQVPHASAAVHRTLPSVPEQVCKLSFLPACLQAPLNHACCHCSNLRTHVIVQKRAGFAVCTSAIHPIFGCLSV